MVPTTLPERTHRLTTDLNWFRTEIIGRGPNGVTFAMLKPDSLPVRDEILDLIAASGLYALTAEERVLSAVDIKALYWTHVGKFFYDRNAEFIASGPCLLLALAGDDAVRRWRQEIMPRIRERWGQHNDNPEKKHLNLVHGSDGDENAFRELHYFFS